jgi:hypothetical protein
MTPRRRNLVFGGLGLAFVGLLLAAFFATHERVSIEAPTPPTSEARANPLHALTLGLRAAGQTVELKGHIDIRRTPPPRRGTLVLLYPEAQVETDDDSWALLDWVDQGGRLVLPMPTGDAAPSLSTMLRDAFGVEALRGAAADIDCPRLRLADDLRDAVCGTPFEVMERIDDALVWPKAAHARIARLPYGEGEVLLLSELNAFANFRVAPIGTTANAEEDAERRQRRDAQTALMATLAGAWLDGDDVWLLSHRGGSLSALLWREGWPVLLGLGLALLAWLRWAGPRFGPMVPSPVPHRRALMEHIDAAGQFAFRNDHGASLHAALREAVLERLAQRHALARLDEAALVHALADRSRLPREAIASALSLPPKAAPDAFREAVATLATLLHRL